MMLGSVKARVELSASSIFGLKTGYLHMKSVLALQHLSPNNPQQSQPLAAGTVKPRGFDSPCAQR